MHIKAFLVCALALSIGLPSFAQSPWDGTWKLNREKSRTSGPVSTVTQDAAGTFHVSWLSGNFAISYACDGKDYPTGPDDTISCRKVSETVYDFVNKHKGKVEAKDHSVLSDNDSVTMDTEEDYHPDGTVTTTVSRSERVGTGKGYTGTWKSAKVESNAPGIMILKLSGDALRIENPTAKSVLIAKLDGTRATRIVGEDNPEWSYMVKATGPRQLRQVWEYKGKPTIEGTMTLSDDGLILTDEVWEPSNSNEHYPAVYERQTAAPATERSSSQPH